MISFKNVDPSMKGQYKADKVVVGIDDFMAIEAVSRLKKAIPSQSKADDTHRKVCYYVALTMDYRSPLTKLYPDNVVEREKMALKWCDIEHQDLGQGLKPNFDALGQDIFVNGVQIYLRKVQMEYVKATHNEIYMIYLGEKNMLYEIFQMKSIGVLMDANEATNHVMQEQIKNLDLLNKMDPMLPLRRVKELENLLRGSADVNTVIPFLTEEQFKEVTTTDMSSVSESQPKAKRERFSATV